MRPPAILRGAWRKRRYWKWLIHDERSNPFHPGWGERLRAWRKGFLSRNYRWFGLDGRDASDYLSDRVRYLGTSSINEPYANVLDDKLLFHEVFRRHDGLLPDAYALLRKGQVIPLSAEGVASVDAVLDLLTVERRLILKPTTGGGGAGVTVLERCADGRFSVGGEPRSRDETREFLATRREQIVEQYVECAAYARAIYPGTSNTIRVLTVWEEETEQAFLPYAIHRFGTRRSNGVDNFARGGVAAWIDVETGTMGPVVSMGPDGRPAYSRVHPETGAAVEGVIVPHWARLAERMVALAADYPFIPYVGWDLVITDAGMRIFEGNSFTGAEVFQLQRPLLAHPRLRRFYQRRGVIP